MQRLHNFPFNTRDVVKMSIIWSDQGEGATPWLAESNCENNGFFLLYKMIINQNYGNLKADRGINSLGQTGQIFVFKLLFSVKF